MLLVCLAAAAPITPDARGVVVPDRAFDMVSLTLDLDLRPDEHAVEGTATWEVARLSAGDLVLDQVGLDIRAVTVDGAPAPWRVEGDTVRVEVGEGARVAVRYRATPWVGLHFRDAVPPYRYPEVWSHGEGEDNRYWFPGWDHPNDRFRYHGEIRAPAGWKVLTNLDVDLTNYLVMVAAAPYRVVTRGDDEVWLPPGHPDASIPRILDPIPAMKAHFAERTGTPYPWGRYRQVFVQGFLFGGMENTSATTENLDLAGDDRIAGTRASRVEKVVAHELAHQWFGDLLTCRNWREMWLNEGFTTFMEADWMGRSRGPEHAAAAVRRRFLDSLAGRSLAGSFILPEQGDSNNPYAKGSSVLQMLKVMLGEATFWAGIRRYVADNHHRLVDSEDLRAAMEAVSGQELGWFFQQWVQLPYVPKLTVRHSYQDGTVTVTVKQASDDTHPRYTIPITVDVGTAAGPARLTGWLDDAVMQLNAPSSAPPLFVAFDPEGGVLADVDQEQDAAAWAAQLQARSAYARVVAIEQLGKTGRGQELAALLADPHAAESLRIAAAVALGKQRQAVPLLASIGGVTGEVRLAVVDALGETVGREAVTPLVSVARTDRSPDIRGRAIAALGRLDPRTALPLARDVVRRAKGMAAEEDRLLGDAVTVLGDHGGPEDLQALASLVGPGRARLSGWQAAAKIIARVEAGAEANARRDLQGRLISGLEAQDQREREGAVALLAELGDERAVAALEALARRPDLRRLRDAATEAVTRIRARKKDPPTATPNETAARLDALEKRVKEMEERGRAEQERH
jgi:aminopeptidase N